MTTDVGADTIVAQGKPVAPIIHACLVRFRPIMMATLAAIFGTLLIALGTGMGSEARRRAAVLSKVDKDVVSSLDG